MNIDIETRTIDTAGAAKNTAIQKDPCQVHWITVSAETPGTTGLVKIYDGFDTGGRLKWQQETAYAKHNPFISPIPCREALFVYNDANIAVYTIAYSLTRYNKAQE